MDSFTEVSSQGWLSRIGESIKGILVGFVLVLVAFPVLFWNEGRAVKTAKGLEEGAGAVVSVPADSVDAGNEGKLVHVAAQATADATLSDADLGVAAPGIALVRKVEMFQWREQKKSEKRKKLGGGEETVTTYTYEKVWDDSPHASSSFKEQQGHENPDMPLRSSRFTAPSVTLGGFTLPSSLVEQIRKSEALAVDPKAIATPAVAKGRTMHGASGGLYFGANPSTPAVGDLRVTYAVVKPQPVSVVARQVGSSFQPYVASTGLSISMLEPGTVPAAEMFQHAQDANATMTWILRGVGTFVMFLGFGLVFRPLSVVADVIPLVGGLVGLGTALAAAGLAAVGSALTIGVAWIFYRPLIGVPLVVGGLALIVFLFVKGSQARKAARAA